MKRVHYAGTSFITGDAIAHALIDYAHALTETNTSEVVEVPISRADGSPGRVELLIVPTNGMVFETEPTLSRDVTSEALVTDLRQRVSRLASELELASNSRVAAWEVRAGGESALYSDVHTFA